MAGELFEVLVVVAVVLEVVAGATLTVPTNGIVTVSDAPFD
jgi:hypothetical protein